MKTIPMHPTVIEKTEKGLLRAYDLLGRLSSRSFEAAGNMFGLAETAKNSEDKSILVETEKLLYEFDGVLETIAENLSNLEEQLRATREAAQDQVELAEGGDRK